MTTVLVVDDVHENLQLLAEQFEEVGYEVLQAGDGHECLRLARTRVVDCILLDVLMPDYDGLQTLEALKADPATAEIPVVLVSARHDDDLVIEGLETGAQDFVAKPISFPLVLARTQVAIRQRQAALQQQRSQSLATIGTLVGGIAHEFNNLNTIVMGNVDLLLKSADLDPSVKRRLLAIHEASERNAVITSDLLALLGSDGDRPGAGPARIAEAIDATFKLCRKQLVDAKVSTAIKGHGNEVAVALPRQVLIQILINLVINAVHAMQRREDRKLTISCAVRGESAVVDVIDTGVGIPPADQERIFLPFFTTKGPRSADPGDDPVTAGTGLGLTTVARLLQGHGGAIRVQSMPDRGSCFRLVLPLARVARPVESDSSGMYHRDLAGLRVLLADDERSLREIVTYLIEDLGGRATAVADGRQALEHLRRHEVDVALIDWSMPVMGGREFLEGYATLPGKRRPEIVICSGLIHDEEIRFIREQGVKHILSKPIRRRHLAATLRRLGRRRSGTGRTGHG